MPAPTGNAGPDRDIGPRGAPACGPAPARGPIARCLARAAAVVCSTDGGHAAGLRSGRLDRRRVSRSRLLRKRRAASGPEGEAIPFPAYCAERRFRLSGGQMRIGRRSVSRGVDPEIDLTGPPADPGISRLHAVLIAEPDGSWSVLDPGSANGTSVNGAEIPTGNRVALHDGDRINVGAWTAITVHRG